VSEQKKKTKRDVRLEMETLLKGKRRERDSIKVKFNGQRKEIEQSRKDGIRETLSQQGRAKKEADAIKTKAIQSARDKFQTEKQAAVQEYVDAEKLISMERDERIEAAAQICQAASHDAAKACSESMRGPSKAHEDEMKEIEASAVEMLGDGKEVIGSIAESEKHAVKKVEAEIAVIEDELKKLDAKKSQPEAVAEASA